MKTDIDLKFTFFMIFSLTSKVSTISKPNFLFETKLQETTDAVTMRRRLFSKRKWFPTPLNGVRLVRTIYGVKIKKNEKNHIEILEIFSLGKYQNCFTSKFNSQAPVKSELAQRSVFELSRLSVNNYFKNMKNIYSKQCPTKTFYVLWSSLRPTASLGVKVTFEK